MFREKVNLCNHIDTNMITNIFLFNRKHAEEKSKKRVPIDNDVFIEFQKEVIKILRKK